MYWLFIYGSKYFLMTATIKPSQNFLIPSKKTEFTELSLGCCNSSEKKIIPKENKVNNFTAIPLEMITSFNY